MKHFKKGLFLAAATLGAFLYTEAAEAYAWTFTNTLNEKVAVDVYGIARIGGSMFQGSGKDVQKTTFGKTVRYGRADRLKGPQYIEPGVTTTFYFGGLYTGYCIDMRNVRVGSQKDGFSVQKRTIKMVKDAYFNNLLATIDKTASGISSAGSSVSGAGGTAGQVAGAVTSAAGNLIGAFSHLEQVSACKAASFAIGRDKDGILILVTADFS